MSHGTTPQLLLAFLDETTKRGTYHDLVDGYLRMVLDDPAYANPFRYYVRYEAAAHLGIEATEALHKLLTVESADVVERGEFRSAGGDPSGYDPDLPGIARGYTAAIVRLAEAIASSRHPHCEDTARFLDAAVRDFADNLRREIGAAAADLFQYQKAGQAAGR